MIIIYRISDDILVQVIPGYLTPSVVGGQLFLNGVLAISDLTIMNYLLIPDQPVNVPTFMDADGSERMIPTPYTALGLKLIFDYDDLPCCIHLATLVAVNPAGIKPAVVRRHFDFNGLDYDIPAYVTQAIKDEWVAGDIAIGDYVIVIYCEERINDALVIAKVFKSWP